MWFNIDVLRAENAHRSNLSKSDILQTNVRLNGERERENGKKTEAMAPTTNPFTTIHTENTQRIYIYPNVFFSLFYSYFSFSFYLSPRINMRIGIFCFLLLFATIVLVSHVRQICALFLFCVCMPPCSPFFLFSSVVCVVLFHPLFLSSCSSMHTHTHTHLHHMIRIQVQNIGRIMIEKSTSWATTIKMITMWNVGSAIEASN